MAMVHIGFHRLVPCFHVGVVGHAARAVHGLLDPAALERSLEICSQEFHPPVAMEEHARRRLPGAHRGSQCATRQRCRLVRAESPSEQAPGMAVHHRRQVTPLILNFQVRDVADPHLIRALYIDLVRLALDAVEEFPEAGQAAVQAGRAGTNAVLAHQTLDASLADSLARSAQGRMDTGAAIGLAAGLVGRSNLLQQARIVGRAHACRPLSPSVVTRGAHAVEAAHRPHRERLLAMLDEGKHVPFRAEVNAIAFFRSSCSSLRRS